ncbi:hypothetical protein [Roseimaritima sediminicola]|uniref:hypothetical protein n=1 Tax=Roseimaritima sediminicola TaxID=2662066 RepID=UPI001298572B|nr:hypothetical protein [Roseimaritima sediminicola]
MAISAPFRSVLGGVALVCAAPWGGIAAAEEPWEAVHIAAPGDRGNAADVDLRRPRSLRALLTEPEQAAEPERTAQRDAPQTVRTVGFVAGDEQPAAGLRALPSKSLSSESLPPLSATDHNVSFAPMPAPVPTRSAWRSAACRCGKPQNRHHRGAARKQRDDECQLVKVLDGVAAGIEHSLKLKSPHQRQAEKLASTCNHCANGAGTSGRSGPSFDSDSNYRPHIGPETVPAGRPLPDDGQPSGQPQPGELSPERLPRLPAPVVPDELSDPFEDDAAWLPGRDPSIRRSAYFE